MHNEPELRQLRTFLTVAEELHFTRAAARLNIAQQALSAQIRKLEERLGVELFKRTTRRVELTEAGRTLLAHAVPLMAAASRAWDEVSRAGSGETGQVTISYAPTARREVVPLLVAEMHRRFPRVEVKSCELWLGPAAVTSGIVDIAILRGPVPEEPGVSGVILLESALGIVLGADHPLAGADAIAVEQLAGSALEIPARRFAPGFYDVIVGALQSQGFAGEVLEYENLGPRYLLDDDVACAEIVAGRAFGIGFEGQYGVLPDELVWLPIEPVLYVPMSMCWRESCGPSVRNFTAVALDVARERSWLRRDRGSVPSAGPRRAVAAA